MMLAVLGQTERRETGRVRVSMPRKAYRIRLSSTLAGWNT